MKEEYAIILDFLPYGYPFDKRPMHVKTPIAQALGKINLVLLELIPKKDVILSIHDEVYIGEGKRDKIHHIAGRLLVNKLTETAKTELNFVIEDIVKKDEKRIMLEMEGNEKHNLFIRN